ncbi:MAG: hypothetical protein U5K79_03445 [Cyclobacteriaceae bacterium]|nr:hypothetical protein [Cyclobacteriaceae bacterium]
MTREQNVELLIRTSNLHALLEGIQNDYESRNLACYHRAFMMAFTIRVATLSIRPYNFNISAVRLADPANFRSIPDIRISNTFVFTIKLFGG